MLSSGKRKIKSGVFVALQVHTEVRIKRGCWIFARTTGEDEEWKWRVSNLLRGSLRRHFRREWREVQRWVQEVVPVRNRTRHLRPLRRLLRVTWRHSKQNHPWRQSCAKYTDVIDRRNVSKNLAVYQACSNVLKQLPLCYVFLEDVALCSDQFDRSWTR